MRKAEWRPEEAFRAAMSPEYLRPDDEVLADMRDECDLRLTLKRGGNLIQLFACAKFRAVTALVAGHGAESVEACIGEHRASFDSFAGTPVPERLCANFAFWYLGGKGPEREEKELNVPSWQEIKDNYNARTSEGLETLMSGFKPGAGGRLLLWHGRPGTGKTFAIRALAWEWRGWCQFGYILEIQILDPDIIVTQGKHARFTVETAIKSRELEAKSCPLNLEAVTS